MRIRTEITRGLTALLLAVTPLARGAGVTIITHGLNGNADGWVTGMAEQIPNYPTFPGSGYTLYKLYFIPAGSGSYQLTWMRVGGSQPTSTGSGEIVVALDWSQLSDGNSFNTVQLAVPVASALQDPNFISELNGHALAELPLHLIGHSRGGSLMSQVSLLLGTSGVWVDHLTTLDPHPLDNDGFDWDWWLYSVVDAPVRTYENVLFHDNYWEDLDTFVRGEAVSGAYVRQLYYLSAGYYYTGDPYYPHSNVHLWYHGTVDARTPTTDTIANAWISGSVRTNWYTPYENQGSGTGFKWSLIGGGDRTSWHQPVGPGYPAIRDGYNQVWDLGAGQGANRTAVTSNNGAWPNVVKFNLVSTNRVQTGGSISVTCFYQWAQPSTSAASLSFYIDDDANPLNANSRLLQHGLFRNVPAVFH